MKKYFIILCAAFAFAACNKIENITVTEDEPSLTQQEITFNFMVSCQDETKSKTGWEYGDVIYVFFKNVESKYAKISYDGTNWTVFAPTPFTVSDFSGISSLDKVLTAVHFPSYAGPVTVTYESNKFNFTDAEGNKIYTHYMFATAGYSVAATTVTASFTMSKPAGFVQFFVPMSEGELANNYSYRLWENNVKPMALISVDKGGTMEYDDSKTAGYAIPGFRTTNNTKEGFMFSAYLETAGDDTDYTFNLITIKSEAKPYALGTQTLEGNRNINSGVIFNFPESPTTSWSTRMPYVDLNLGGTWGHTLWAVGNLNNGVIGDPERRGDFFAFADDQPRGTATSWRPYDPEHEIDLRNTFTWATYKYSYNCSPNNGTKFTKYVSTAKSEYWGGEGAPDNKTIMDLSDDPAVTILGGNWKTPGYSQMSALLGACKTDGSAPSALGGDSIPASDWRRTSDGYLYDGRLIMGGNGICIFMPAYMFASGATLQDGYHGLYWTNLLNGASPGLALAGVLSYWEASVVNYNRLTGCHVRPIFGKRSIN